eukprot:m.210092 g.210092  ORF g.210092 m.210092 type:complete len:61 (+) comp33060_c0_seq2:1394-1576(+)
MKTVVLSLKMVLSLHHSLFVVVAANQSPNQNQTNENDFNLVKPNKTKTKNTKTMLITCQD